MTEVDQAKNVLEGVTPGPWFTPPSSARMGWAMWQLISSVLLILSYLFVISVGCLLAGVAALFDGSHMWFSLSGISLGVLGLFCTHYHLRLAIEAYRKVKDTK